MLSGVLLLPEYAALSQVAYLILGLAGLPVFANGGGVGYILQPTFGYLLSLPLAAYVVAGLRMRSKKSLSLYGLFGRALFGLTLVLALGDVWLYFALKFGMGKTVSLFHIILVGAVVFLPGALLKAFLVALIGRSMQRRFNA